MTVSLLVLAVALAADAVAVSLAQGAAVRGSAHATALRLGAAFGTAQGVMPLIGWAFGLLFARAIAAFDHWVAFAVLVFLGVKLFREGLAPVAPEARPIAGGWTLAALALATSIDAAGAGLALDAMRVEPLFAAATIAAITAALCAGAVYAGRAVGARLGPWAECAGGAALIAIGVKVLLEHRAFG
jgi:putative Mn2+ efflux pump MntP